jgi:urea transport system substrate-binding protein
MLAMTLCPTRRTALLAIGASLALEPTRSVRAQQPTIKVGILHSLSGTMAISETPLKDTMLMLIDEQNRKGGLLGRRLEAVVVDPASDWPRFAQQARVLLERDKVAAVFGCWTSVSRKAVLPVFEQLDGLLFYPLQYEGEESSRNVVYTGATPNQQAIPAVAYLMEDLGVQRWALLGTDYVYPRTTNRILQAWLAAKGVTERDILVRYTPFGHRDWRPIVEELRAFAAQGRKTAVVSMVNGDANIAFYKELARQGVAASDIPVMAFSVGEQELAAIDTAPLAGHYIAWNYFMSAHSPVNDEFIRKWQAFTGDPKRVTSDPMEAHYIGFNLWVRAVEKARSTDPAAVRKALIGVRVPNLTGGEAELLPNHHITKPVLIGQIRKDGRIRTVWQTKSLIPGDAWSDYLPESQALTADWSQEPGCGRYDRHAGKCLEAGRR